MVTKGDLVMGCRKEIDYYKSKKSRKKQKSSGKSRRVQVKTEESGQKQKSPSKNNRIRAKAEESKQKQQNPGKTKESK